MGDKPILFSGPMVRAILDGRKTQTRRLAKGIDPVAAGSFHVHNSGGGCFGVFEHEVPRVAPDYMRWTPGDRLYVREAWKPHSLYDHLPPREIPQTKIFYLADGGYSPSGSRGRPGIHMPRWASRLTLEVTDVRVERLQDISEDDAIAEGWPVDETSIRDAYPIGWYANLWERINGKGAWEANPWIVALTFSVERRNIDALTPPAAMSKTEPAITTSISISTLTDKAGKKTGEIDHG